jgi:hypothetical protein
VRHTNPRSLRLSICCSRIRPTRHCPNQSLSTTVRPMFNTSHQQNLVEWARPYLAGGRKLTSLMDQRLGSRYPPKAELRAAKLASKCLTGNLPWPSSSPRSRRSTPCRPPDPRAAAARRAAVTVTASCFFQAALIFAWLQDHLIIIINTKEVLSFIVPAHVIERSHFANGHQSLLREG